MHNQYRLTGLSLHLLKLFVKRKSLTKYGELARHFFELGTRDEIMQELKLHTEPGLVVEPVEDEYQISSKGEQYLKEFNLLEKARVFGHRYDLAIIKFLYEFGDAVHEDDFPTIIISSAPQSVNGSQEFQFVSHLGYGHQMKQCLSERHGFWSLTDLGRARYEHEFPVQIEPARSILQTQSSTTSKMSHKPLVFIGSSSESYYVAKATIQNMYGQNLPFFEKGGPRRRSGR